MLKNITFSANENLIRKAREKAHREKTTLNTSFRQWLKFYVGKETKSADYDNLMQKLDYVNVGNKYSRDELNAR
jgi:hypothetical protein